MLPNYHESLDYFFCLDCKKKIIIRSNNGYGHGICGCYRYPLVDNILILKKRPDTEETARLISEGKFEHAKLLQTEVSFSLYHRILNKLTKQDIGLLNHIMYRFIIQQRKKRMKILEKLMTEKKIYTLFSALEAGKWGEYCIFRFVSESFIIGKHILQCLSPNIKIKKQGIILDHLCGAGHYSFILSNIFKNCRVISTDQSFLNLFITKNFFNKNGIFLCIDGNNKLPIKEKIIDLFWSSDAFHYLIKDRQRYLVEDYSRVLGENGVLVQAHLHIKGGKNVGEGNSHTLSEYETIFSNIPSCSYNEQEIMTKLFQNYRVDGDAIILIGTKNKEELETIKKKITKSIGKRKPAISNSFLYQNPLINLFDDSGNKKFYHDRLFENKKNSGEWI